MGKKKKKQSGGRQRSLTEQIFEDGRSSLRNAGGKRRSLEQLELVEPWYSRRVKAVERYVPLFEERYREKYPELEAETFIECCSTPAFAYDLMESDYSLTLGAALWILDELKLCGKTGEAMELLAGCGEAGIPELCDLTHTAEEIRKVLFAIRNRCGADEDGRSLLPKGLLTEKEPSPEHRRFQALISLLPEAHRERAAETFRNKVMEWMDTETALEEEYRAKKAELSREYDALTQKLDALLEDGPKPVLPGGASAGRPGALPDLSSLMKPDFRLPAAAESGMERARVLKLAKELDRIDEERDDISIRYRSLRLRAPLCQCGSTLFSLPRKGAEPLRPMLEFTVGSPYEICYALLELLDSGDDLPWLYYYPLAVVGAAAARLPWTLWGVSGEEESGYADMEYADPYERKYRNGTADGRGFDRLSQAQLVYRGTGVLLPRLCPAPDAFRELLKECGVRKQSRPQLALLLSVLAEAKKRDAEEEKPETAAKDGDEAELETLRRELKQLRHENESLRQNAYSAQREAKTQTERLERLGEETERTKQELTELRDYVFSGGEDTAEETEEITKMRFPQPAAHRTVVFGGHDSWRREIRKKLPDVRFIDRDQAPSAELIRRAELVWVQPNSISHARFYTILDITRKHDIPLHYFSYAGAAKCAEQLVLLDRSLK